MSERRACAVLMAARATVRYQALPTIGLSCRFRCGIWQPHGCDTLSAVAHVAEAGRLRDEAEIGLTLYVAEGLGIRRRNPRQAGT